MVELFPLVNNAENRSRILFEYFNAGDSFCTGEIFNNIGRASPILPILELISIFMLFIQRNILIDLHSYYVQHKYINNVVLREAFF